MEAKRPAHSHSLPLTQTFGAYTYTLCGPFSAGGLAQKGEPCAEEVMLNTHSYRLTTEGTFHDALIMQRWNRRQKWLEGLQDAILP